MNANAADARQPYADLTTEEVLRLEYRELWPGEVGDLETYGAKVFANGQAALCLSGGGIRSAAFALGVVQSLAKKRLLTHFQYLSTVSGGGYTGSWLARWMHDRDGDADAVQAALGGSDDAIGEPAQITQLRENSNFLTPRLGLASADTWTAIAVSLRNILINWLIFGPLLLLTVILPHLYSHLIALVRDEAMVGWSFAALAIGAGLLGLAVYFGCRNLPSHVSPPDPAHQGWFSRMAAQVDGLLGRTDSLGRPDGAILFWKIAAPALAWSILAPLALGPITQRQIASTAVLFPGESYALPWLAMVAGYLVALVCVPKPDRPSFRANLLLWIGASTASMAGLWLGFWLFRYIFPEWRNDFLTTFAPLFVIVVHLLLSVIFVAFRRTGADPAGKQLATDLDREWLARISALKLRPGLFWMLLAFCVLFLPRLLLDEFSYTVNWLTGAVATVSGVASVLGGKSSVAGFGKAAKGGLPALSMNAMVSIATIIFAAALLLFLSRVGLMAAQGLAYFLGWWFPMFLSDHGWGSGDAAVASLGWAAPDPSTATAHPTLGGETVAFVVLLGLIGLALIATSSRINVNRFSLNALYRNRIARGFLGAARTSRRPDPFTGFDPTDNVRMHQLHATARRSGKRVLLPVVNVALNVVNSDRLAWQERKAEPFVITPIACGSAMLKPSAAGAYVRSENYGGNEPDLGLDGTGITLATAVTISGAAASPSMGYHSSPATAFLMTLFNVRLGAWLPNPARARDLQEDVERSGPTNALRPLLSELAGLTNDRGYNVYLSDGGHFENLGLYEMVRRRCRFIVVSDAGCDPNCHFEDLGNAVRKIRIDQEEIEIRFDELRVGSRANPVTPQYAYALGEIRYPKQADPGLLLYIKPSYFGPMPLDIRAYAATNQDFPHESTSDQWFSESQFESYRRLGEYLTDELGERDYARGGLSSFFEDIRRQQAPRTGAVA